jgi:hypothetical protein
MCLDCVCNLVYRVVQKSLDTTDNMLNIENEVTFAPTCIYSSTYATESRTVTQNDERRVSVLERKIIRRMYGATYEKGEMQQRIRRSLQ